MLELLNLIAAFNGALVGAALLAQERFGPVRPRITLAALLLLVSALLALFVMLDTGRILYSGGLGIAMDIAALLIGALLLDYVATSVSQSGYRLWPYAPAALYLIAAMINGGRFGAPADLRFIVACQIAFTLVALVTYLRASASLSLAWSRRSENLHLPLLLAGVGLIHVAQVMRLVLPSSSFLYDLVPLIGAVGLLAFAVYAMFGSQTLRSLAVQRAPASTEAAFGQALDSVMAESSAFLDPDLSLPKVAALMRTTPARLSSYLNTQRGLNFRSYINSLRIEEAKRLLRDPNEARTSIEAIAKLSGFRSRSVFYSAFQAQVGVTPQEFREKGMSGNP